MVMKQKAGDENNSNIMNNNDDIIREMPVITVMTMATALPHPATHPKRPHHSSVTHLLTQ